MKKDYDVIVVGGGHAGCEAAAAAANLGAKTLLITMDMTKFANMSCNPAIGGIAKGQIVREIDALGGYTGVVTDKSTIQFRMLNKSKGPAMWSPRAQCDRVQFSIEWRKILESIPNLFFWQDIVTELIIEDNTIKGVRTKWKSEFYSKAVILTNGTFLNGIMFVGDVQVNGGRAADEASYGITEQLKNLGFETDRMKTGTPVRIDGRTVDFSKMTEQHGDERPLKFSFSDKTQPVIKQRSCFMTYTSEEVHEVLSGGLERSPLYDGTIKGIGPRYCPSIETKILTFPDKNKHLLFLEPEGFDTEEFYLNGFSSSLPLDVQINSMRRIPGLEYAEIFRPGYAIEYDFFQPTQLYATMETKQIPNLYFAGQINGTTGYEEAGAQGIIAGINAVRKMQNKPEFTLNRDEAYIGVLIDDLITKGVDEPYRMFTSRAEYRILLRQDNADERLVGKGYTVGLVSKKQYDYTVEKYLKVNNLIEFMNNFSIKPQYVNDYLNKIKDTPLNQGVKLSKLILRPKVFLSNLFAILKPLQKFVIEQGGSINEVLELADLRIKYGGYIEREKELSDKINRLQNIILSPKIDYLKLKSISTEGRQKLNKIKPTTIAQARRISGVSPSDINAILIHIGR